MRRRIVQALICILHIVDLSATTRKLYHDETCIVRRLICIYKFTLFLSAVINSLDPDENPHIIWILIHDLY